MFGAVTLFLVFLTLFGSAVFPALQEGILLGRSEEGIGTLTGRVALWAECLEYVWRRPLLGYGFSSFWTPNMIEEVSFSQGWGISSSHSVYLEYALSLGLAGLTLFLAFMWASVAKSSKLLKQTGKAGYAFVFGLLILSLTHGVLTLATINPAFPMFLIMVCLAEIGFVTRVNQDVAR